MKLKKANKPQQVKDVKFNMEYLLSNFDKFELGDTKDTQKQQYVLFNAHPSKQAFTLSQVYKYLGENRTNNIATEMVLSPKFPSLNELKSVGKEIFPDENIRQINKEIAIKTKAESFEKTKIDFDAMLESLNDKLMETKKSKELSKEERNDKRDYFKLKIKQLKLSQKKQKIDMQKVLTRQSIKQTKKDKNILEFNQKSRDILA